MHLKALTLFFIVLYCQSEVSSSLKILGVFPFPGRSHFAMFGALMRELARRGHQVDVIGMFPLEKPMPNYTDIDIRATKQSYLFNNMSYPEAMELRRLTVTHLIELCAAPLCNSLNHPNMQKFFKTKKGSYDVMIVEVFLADCFTAIGKYIDAPVVGIISLRALDWILEDFGLPMNPSYIPSIYSRASQYMTFWERLKNTLITHYLTAQVHYNLEAELPYVEKHFNRKLASIRELRDDVSLLLVNEYFTMNDIRPTPPNVIGVGGLHVIDDGDQLTPELQKWLDESTHGCVYFTFGSMIQIETFPTKTVKIFYEMFRRIAPVRVLVKIMNPQALVPGLPENVKTARWMPQIAVLKHRNVRLFITHGGLMGTQEAVVFKVPMVGLPVFIDQPSNMEGYVSKGVAINLDLDSITADSLTSAVKTVLNDPSYRQNMDELHDLFLDRPMSAMDTAVYWVEHTARHPTILKHPVKSLSWWQFYLLDVYGFLLVCLLLTLFLVFKILRLLGRSLYKKPDEKHLDIKKKN
ncbi:UDP-glucuronosyltransferase 2A3-like [Fopius arisanus]|uniref:UDP-glucuronosyltransferase n=1 Tax=Fopius arisanus TaxID=64838 RepID=A0A0C9RQS3_9HYME|nr:PREDICTED: UDP-glucuronosyltransferase 2A3-like [Fopius arisanus]